MGLGPACGSPGPDEAGGGYNSEDEYEAGRVEMDPATAEQEHRFEKALREKKGFIIKRMKEDGACLFRAVADQVYGDQDMHEVVRKHCMDYLMKNADYFSNYVTEDFTTYINRKRKSTCHGNHIEMQAMAEMYNRPVEVYQYGTEPINTFHGIQHNEDEPIRVSYHRNIHYNSVVNPNKATIGVGLGLPSFKPGLAEQSLMKSAIKTSEESWIEQQMLEDKKRATDWEATNEAIEEQVARESYLQWLRDQEKQARQPRKASATCSSATAAAASGHSVVTQWSLSGHSGVTQGSLRGQWSLSGHSGSLSGHSGVTQGSLSGHSGVTQWSLSVPGGHSVVTHCPSVSPAPQGQCHVQFGHRGCGQWPGGVEWPLAPPPQRRPLPRAPRAAPRDPQTPLTRSPPRRKTPLALRPRHEQPAGGGGGSCHAPPGVAVPRARVPRHHAANVPNRLRPERLGG
ncbi:OTU domain-containing protein 5-like isoform X1 [Poecile atricapillus]|uniref:OTU domain-containing protein 5-like isoform X1 n=1 Tax=Poecile atricapillus TaxID=48891 RepID=UPI00273986EE|nr:OTU domain-containing protein 5-like isoform X1 [Poecile atricapillus]